VPIMPRVTDSRQRGGALSVAVAVEQRQIETGHTHTFGLADLYSKFLLTGKTPIPVGL